MASIVVTGAAGVVGRRLVATLLRSPDHVPPETRILALDRVPLSARILLERPAGEPGAGSDHNGSDRPGSSDDELAERLEVRRLDPATADLEPLLRGARSVVHLADEGSGPRRASMVDALANVQDAARRAEVEHMVVLSSAMVYGARADNPVPIPETQPIRPEPSLDYAMLMSEVERRSRSWARDTGAALTVLRPAIAFSPGHSSWIGLAFRAALSLRPDQVDPPVQFLHHHDVADAIGVAVAGKLHAVYNVAAAGWMGADEFRALRGESEVRLPERIGRLRLRAAKYLADESLLAGLEPYVQHPWVVATDRLRAQGWRSAYSNEETYVAGTPAPLVASIGPRRRQELALGAASATGAAVVGGMVWAARRLSR